MSRAKQRLHRSVVLSLFLSAVWLLLTGAGCSGKVIPQGGLMLVVRTDGTLSQATRLHLEVTPTSGGAAYRSADYAIPSETTLPTTLGIATNGSATATVAINASLWAGTTLLDNRANQVLQIPTDRVAELDIVFSAKCTALARVVDGAGGSSCATGQTCDPATGTCVNSTIQGVALPTYGGDAGAAPSSTASDAGADAAATLAAIASLDVAIGRSVDLEVTRAGDLSSALELSLSGLPTGVASAPATIAANATSTTLTLVAAAIAPLTAIPVSVTVKSTATAGATPTATFALSVVGMPGSLDVTFGANGVTAPLATTGGQVTGVGFQKSGAIVAGGYAGSQLGVARYTGTGALDTSFGTSGSTFAAPAGATSFDGSATNLGVKSDDSLLVGGNFRFGGGPGSKGGPLARFTPSGALDATLLGAGFSAKYTNPFGAGLALDATGRTLVVGPKSVIRQLADNTTDPSFGTGGQIEYLDLKDVEAVGFLSDGTIIHAGPNFVGALSQSTGDPLPTFGTGGFLTSTHGFRALAVAPSDAIFLAGSEPNGQLLVAKVTRSGAMDATFATNGVLSLPVGESGPGVGNAIAVQKDGKLVIAGNTTSGGHPAIVVVRLLATGALDTTFGADNAGVVYVKPAASAGANAVAIASDGKIVVGGWADQDWVVARLWP